VSSDESPLDPSAESEVPVASARPEAPALGRARWRRLELGPVGARLPDECACCGAPVSAHTVVRRGRDAAELLVGYCGECHEHVGKDGTRALGVGLASFLLGASLGVALPLTMRAPLLVVVLTVLAASLAPLLVAWALRPRPARGHSAWGGAVHFSGASLACARSDYADRVFSLNPKSRELESSAAPWFSPWMLAGPLIALSATPFAYELSFPSLRVLNLTGERFEIWVDGRLIGSVAPTSVESPLAGRDLEVAAGSHLFEVRDAAGAVVAKEEGRLVSGKSHLFAPASSEYCFWIETLGYGRGGGATERRPLEGNTHFWVLPDGIDRFFTPPGAEGALAANLSGGSVTVLRQAPCAQAPAEVRPP
jgi:hypothetical protein